MNYQAFIEDLIREEGFIGEFRLQEPMAAHTTFRVGGPADLWVRPRGETFPGFARALLRAARREGAPVFILGGGANLVVADRGIRGIVLDTGGWNGREEQPGETSGEYRFRAGSSIEELTGEAAGLGLSGLEFLAGMPGSLGGAVWMNARCYGKSLSDILFSVEILDDEGRRVSVPFRPEDYAYKKSPFQNRRALILSADLALHRRPEGEIRREMEEHRQDREAKGQYRFPSGGSVFKNNHTFGKPSGQIIDAAGLRGLTLGGAQVAPWHGNLIINRGDASASDIRRLTRQVQERVLAVLGFDLEPELLFVGEW